MRQSYILSPCLFNLYAEYIMWNARLDEAQAIIKIAGGNINNLRYADNITLMAESKEELKNFLMKVKEKQSHSVMSDSATHDCTLPGSSGHEILQARTLKWVTISFSRGSSRPRDQTLISDRRFTVWATREAHSDEGERRVKKLA